MNRVDVAPLDAFPIDRGVAAVVNGEYVAIFRLADGELAAVDHIDPCSGVPVLARGLIGSAGGVPTVASPLHKQRFELRTGRCLDEPSKRIRVWPVEVVDGRVMVASEPIAAVPDPTPESDAGADSANEDAA